MYAELLGRLGDDLAAGGVTLEILAGHEDDPGPSALALRLVGSLHRVVLTGAAVGLRSFYPSVGGTWDLDAAWPAIREALREHHGLLRELLSQPPQTNEVGRASALLGGLLQLVDRHRLPVRLFEVGASAGLNLRADHFHYRHEDGTAWGSAASPVVLERAWRGRALPISAPLRITERHGYDVAPVDVSTAEGRLTAMAYVWPDQQERFERLRAAMNLAGRVPARLQRRDAVSALREMDLGDGTATVVWHSVMWQYLSRGDQDAMGARLEQLGAEATPSRAFAVLSLEPARRTPESEHEFLVVLRDWPGGRRTVLGAAAPHGVPTTWE